MTFAENYSFDAYHPIDIAQDLATGHEWDFERNDEDRITMRVEGLWRSYTLTLDWDAEDGQLRVMASFDLTPPEDKLPALYETLNHVNADCPLGHFTFWAAATMVVWRCHLLYEGDQTPGADLLDHVIGETIMNAERYYPAIQLALWGDKSPAQALHIAISETHGHA